MLIGKQDKLIIKDPGSASTTRHPMRCTVRPFVVHFEVEFTVNLSNVKG